MEFSLSESDPELLSDSLELIDSTPLECAASNELQQKHKHWINIQFFSSSNTYGNYVPGRN